MALHTARSLAAQHGVALRTAQRWIARALVALAADPAADAYPVVTVDVAAGRGARSKARALVMPDAEAA